jgi:PTS system nitrogen regulatory IIA component
MELAGILDQRRCTVALEAKTKPECLEELATLMAESDLGVSRDALLAALRERESLGSTGFENGVAIPHARLPGEAPFALGVAVSPGGVDYDSSDGSRSTLFFVLVGPEDSPQEYLRFLAHISRVGLNPTARDEIRAFCLFPQAGVAIGLALVVQNSTLFTAAPGAVREMLRLLTNVVLFSVFANELIGPLISRFGIVRGAERE